MAELTSGPEVETLATVRVDDLELCPRFTARVITGVEVGPSPRWLARRLTLAGMRPINNVVDASNYVMLELGQPSHPYDLDRLPGHGLVVRRARPGETRDHPRRGRADARAARARPRRHRPGLPHLRRHRRPVAIGGVMGGASSEIGPRPSRVLLEAAYFVPDGHRPDLEAAGPAHRGLGPVRAGLRPGRHRSRGRSGSASCSA